MRRTATAWCLVAISATLLAWGNPPRAQADDRDPPEDAAARIEDWIDSTIDTLEQANRPHLDLQRGPLGEARGRATTGTSWVPARSPTYALLFPVRGWGILVRGNLFLGYGWGRGRRGARGFANGSTLMVGAIGPLGPGELSLRGVLSSEAYSLPEGSPAPLSPEQGRSTDRQLPRSLMHEVAGAWTVPLRGRVALQGYAAITGSPALGPPDHAFRPSAYFDPVAPLSRSLLESTRSSPGVVTLGVQTHDVKLEGSWFRAPRTHPSQLGLDLGRFDSGALRLSFAPIPQLALQLSCGRVYSRDTHMPRTVATTSLLWSSGRPGSGFNAGVMFGATLATEEAPQTTLLLEGSWQHRDHHAVFGRLQVRTAATSAYLVDADPQAQTSVGSLAAGYVYSFRPLVALAPGLGVRAEAGPVAEELRGAYDGPVAFGFTVFGQLRQASLMRAP